MWVTWRRQLFFAVAPSSIMCARARLADNATSEAAGGATGAPTGGASLANHDLAESSAPGSSFAGHLPKITLRHARRPAGELFSTACWNKRRDLPAPHLPALPA